VRRWDAVLGALVAGTAFEVMKRGFGLYIVYFPTYKLVYGTFAAVPIFLLWVYLSWLIVLCGAVLVAVLPQWRAGLLDEAQRPGGNFFVALAMLAELRAAHRAGELRREDQLAARVGIPIDRAERVLDAMAVSGWVVRAAGPGWVLARDAGAIRVADVWRAFALACDAVPTAAEAARRLREDVEAVMPMTLEEWCAAGDTDAA
jgi:membrane protein